MPRLKTIQYKALFLLIAFAANFFVVCHCSAMQSHAAGHLYSCCEKASSAREKAGQCEKAAQCEKTAVSRESAAPEKQAPCGKDGCQHAQAVKFHLLEKQVSDPVIQPPLFAVFVLTHFILLPESATKEKGIPDQWVSPHSPPPDLQVLYQRFLL